MDEEKRDEKLLRQYALGNIKDDAAREDVEKKLMSGEFELDLVEDDLIEDYLENELSTEEKRDFERNFLVSGEREFHLILSGGLKELAAAKASETKDVTRVGNRRSLKATLLFGGLAILAAILIVIWLSR